MGAEPLDRAALLQQPQIGLARLRFETRLTGLPSQLRTRALPMELTRSRLSMRRRGW